LIDLVSPGYSFEEFCSRMFGKDPIAVMDAASAEITYARRNHRETTKDGDFRKGSRGRAYCDDLQRLIGLCMGSIPSDAPPNFLSTVKPLVMHLLQKWEIGDLRAKAERGEFSPAYKWVFHRNGERLIDFRGSWESACQRAGLPDLHSTTFAGAARGTFPGPAFRRGSSCKSPATRPGPCSTATTS
jgi:hypothetical protein